MLTTVSNDVGATQIKARRPVEKKRILYFQGMI